MNNINSVTSKIHLKIKSNRRGCLTLQLIKEQKRSPLIQLENYNISHIKIYDKADGTNYHVEC